MRIILKQNALRSRRRPDIVRHVIHIMRELRNRIDKPAYYYSVRCGYLLLPLRVPADSTVLRVSKDFTGVCASGQAAA